MLYINDIVDGTSSKVRLFADDCLLYREVKSQQDADSLQHDLESMCRWADLWQMKFNVTKCAAVTFKNSRKRKWVSYNYTMYGQSVPRTSTTPYLGVNFDTGMQWTAHVNTTAAKGHRLVGMLWRNLHGCPQSLKEKSYSTIVRPVVEYAGTV